MGPLAGTTDAQVSLGDPLDFIENRAFRQVQDEACGIGLCGGTHNVVVEGHALIAKSFADRTRKRGLAALPPADRKA